MNIITTLAIILITLSFGVYKIYNWKPRETVITYNSDGTPHRIFHKIKIPKISMTKLNIPTIPKNYVLYFLVAIIIIGSLFPSLFFGGQNKIATAEGRAYELAQQCQIAGDDLPELKNKINSDMANAVRKQYKADAQLKCDIIKNLK